MIAEPVGEIAVDAGALSWAFDLPEPTVTHTLAPVPVDHSVDAGSLAWAFDLPSRRSRIRRECLWTTLWTQGRLAWTFNLPEPTVTHTESACDHSVDAGSLAWTFDLPEPTVTHTAESACGPLCGRWQHLTWTFDLPEPTHAYRRVLVDHSVDAGPSISPSQRSRIQPRVLVDHSVDAGNISWTFDLPEPTVTRTERVPVDHSVDAGSLTWTFDLPEPTVTRTERVPVDHSVDAGSLTWTFDLPEPTVTRTGLLLTLADFNDTGLEVETAALLVASAPGTAVNNFYVASSRGGSGTPIEGELGVGTGETVIDRLRRASTENLTLNDSNSPVALDFNAYFGTSGAGADLSVYLQTASDGVVGFTVTSAFLSAGGNWLNVTLPAAARTLLDNLATGERFILALARPAPVPVDHAVDAGAVSWTFVLPEPAVTLTRVTEDHAVDAGAVAWVFDLPEPTVTYTPSPRRTTPSMRAPSRGPFTFQSQASLIHRE